MSTLDGELPGHDDLDDSDGMDFVRDLIDKFQAVEDAGHRLAKKAAIEILSRISWTTLKASGGRELEVDETYVSRLTLGGEATDSLLYLTERCGATYDAETRTLRIPKDE